MNDLERALKESAAKLPRDLPGDAGERLAERAAAEGLLDVSYATAETPVGDLLVAATPRGLVRISFTAGDEVLQELSESLSPRVLEAPARLDPVRRELDEYFEGRRHRFELPLDWSLTQGFFRRVLRATARIGYGRVRTYTEVAASAGRPRAVRAAGNAVGSNPIPIVVPCHRVVRSDGAVGQYLAGSEVKAALLQLEAA
jgi:methylated-DNA-[protein]-cysteine S-methyltransferase